MDEEASHSLSGGCESVKSLTIEDPGTDKGLPLGKLLSTRLPPELIGDVLEVWILFWRFHALLGLQEPLSFDLLSEELIGSWSDDANLLEKYRRECPERKELLPYSAKSVQKVLSQAHISMLKVLINELPKTDADVLCPNFGDKKQKLGIIEARQNKIDMPPVNELTWPELARRYALAVSSINGYLDSAEITIPVLRCLYGDGGLLCGSLPGVAGIEADAKVLATATKKIYASLRGSNDNLTIPDVDSDEKDSSQKLMASEGIPNWAQELIPVRNLPTNNGSRIKKCVNAALGKGPPDGVKKMLENSISKEVYKGNASGPTKRAVVCVLEEVCSEILQQNSSQGVGKTKLISLSDIIMKQCRILLRRVAAADKRQVFCNLPRGRLTDHDKETKGDHDKEIKGILGSQAIVSRPLYFRKIDTRLAAGSYGGSHEAFLEDVQELWGNVRVEFGYKPDLVELADKLSCYFESLYNKEVVDVYNRFKKYAKSKSLSADLVKDIENLVVSSNNLPKAPWEEGICKVCGVDRDDDVVLLCDTCDAEHHIYCLNPPLDTIPEGKWYCSSCIAGNDVAPPPSSERLAVNQQQRSNKIESMQILYNGIAPLAASMEEEEYWMLCPHEKTLLLKFFCDTILTSDFIKQHLQECGSSCPRLRQKIPSLSKELKVLERRENDLANRCLEMYENQLEENCPPNNSSLTIDASELVSNQEVLKSVRDDIRILKKSITDLETELKMRSLRTEFLGVDSAQRFYWIMELFEHPQIIVAEGISQDYQPRCSVKNSVSIGYNDLSSVEGSESRCPRFGERYKNAANSSWLHYQSDAEIKRMIGLLKDDNPIDRRLKESISQWHRLRFQDAQKSSENQNENELLSPFLKPSDNFSSSDSLITKAFKQLVSKYGTFLEMERIDSLKKQDETEKVVAVESKMYRCTCLEPIPPTADHCLICHKTSFNKIELKEHNRKCDIAASSSKPVVFKASEVLRQLKINLLDMYAALPAKAIKSSKAGFDRRCAWHAFVKCASTIYEMVLASIALEDMIKSEHLNRKWWFWSSLSAAVKISTWSSLSLRIYSLDAAIIYKKIRCVSAPLKPKGKPNGKKRQNDPGSSSTGKRARRRQNDPGSSSTGKRARRVNGKKKEPAV